MGLFVCSKCGVLFGPNPIPACDCRAAFGYAQSGEQDKESSVDATHPYSLTTVIEGIGGGVALIHCMCGWRHDDLCTVEEADAIVRAHRGEPPLPTPLSYAALLTRHEAMRAALEESTALNERFQPNAVQTAEHIQRVVLRARALLDAEKNSTDGYLPDPCARCGKLDQLVDDLCHVCRT